MGTRTGNFKRLTWLAIAFIMCGLASIATADSSLEATTENGGKVILTFASEPLRTMTETPFHIELLDATGAHLTDAALSISLEMPAMPMPPNHPAAVVQDDRYRGVAVFTMAGAWQVEVAIERPGQDISKVIFEIDQVLMK